MRGFLERNGAELTQWSLGCTATFTLIYGAESGDWKATAYALAGHLYAALVAWRAKEITREPPDRKER